MELPETFGRYRILKRLGQGGMGSVFLAHDTELDRQVALKVPHFKPEDGKDVLERFYREARAAAALAHPNICPIHDVGAVAGVLYLTMGYVEGKSLAELMRPGKPLPEQQAAALVRKIALALDEAHRHGIVHRDLKPANIMINQRKEPVIMDFGLARRASKDETRLTQSGAIVGTPAYMSPEQVSGKEVGPASDLYSLGVILYEMLTGKLPFEGPMMAMLSQILMDEPPPPSKHRPDLDRKLEAICLTALAKDPGRRHGSMEDLASALALLLKDGAATATIPSASAIQPKLRADSQRTVSVKAAAASTAQGSAWEELTAKTTIAPTRRPTAKTQPLWLLMGLGGVFLVVLTLVWLSGVIFRGQTKNGVVVLTINEPGAQVYVDDEWKITTSRSDSEPIKLEVPEGKHVMKFVKDGFVTETKEFTLKAGTPHEISVTLRPEPMVANGNEKAPFKKGDTVLRPGGLEGRSGAARDQLLREGGGSKETEIAVDRGLRWIVKQQQADGGWASQVHDPAHTALALLPLLGAGHTHQQGVFAKSVDKGLQYLLSKLSDKGRFELSSGYVQGLCTITLCEAYALTKDERLKEPAQRAIDFIVRAQHPAGGWRYTPGQEGDTSVTGWVFSALKTGQLAGLKVPKNTLERVSRFLDGVELPDGSGYGYTVALGGGSGTCAIGLLARLHMGWEPTHPKIVKGLATLTQNLPAPDDVLNIYYYYYATQVMRHVGGDYWKSWEPNMREWLLARQEEGLLSNNATVKDPNPLAGSWSPDGDKYGVQGGRLYVTSLALLTLEAYYRHVPLCFSSNETLEKIGDDWVSLFNGKDLDGWKTHPNEPGNWTVENGILVGRGPQVSHLYTERGDYADFHFLVEAKINAQGDSGQVFRVLEIKPGIPTGYEAQIDSGKFGIKTGSFLVIAGQFQPLDGVFLKASPVPNDTWFTQEVIAQGNRIVIKVNDKTTVDFVDKNDRHRRGYLALQLLEPATVVQFRQVKVKELK